MTVHTNCAINLAGADGGIVLKTLQYILIAACELIILALFTASVPVSHR